MLRCPKFNQVLDSSRKSWVGNGQVPYWTLIFIIYFFTSPKHTLTVIRELDNQCVEQNTLSAISQSSQIQSGNR